LQPKPNGCVSLAKGNTINLRIKSLQKISRRACGGAESNLLSPNFSSSTMLFLFFDNENVYERKIKFSHYLYSSASANRRFDAPLRDEFLKNSFNLIILGKRRNRDH
jgi:hypothetical protein